MSRPKINAARRTPLSIAVAALGSLGALAALASACAPDSSVGSDTLPSATGGAASPSAQGGAATAGAASSQAGAAAAAGAAPAGAGASALAGSGGTIGSSGGSSGSTAGGETTAGATAVGGAAMMGSAGMGGPSLCPVAGTTLCDGFEDAAPGATGSDWTVSVSTGDTFAVDTTKAYRGSKSVKFTAKTSAFIVEKKTFTGTTKATNNALWGRYYFLSNVAAAATYSQSHVVFGALADSKNSGDQFHFVGGSRGKLQAEIASGGDQYTDSMKTPAATSPDYPLLADGWQCWEFHVTADNSFEFYINGKEVTGMKIVAGKASMSGANFSALPIFGSLYLGFQVFSAGTAVSGWLDEVAVGPARIGCGS